MKSLAARVVPLALLLLSQVAAAQDGEDAPAPKYVHMTTSAGDLYIELFPEQAPISAANFAQYVADGFYDGTIFHRVIPGFVIQGGGFTPEMSKKDTKAPIKNEADNGLKNSRGTLSMARTGVVDSATTQFFVNLVDNAALDHTGKTNSRAWGYAVFGEVVRGIEIVDAIGAVPTGTVGRYRDVPLEAVIIESAQLVQALPPIEAAQEASAEAPAAEATTDGS